MGVPEKLIFATGPERPMLAGAKSLAWDRGQEQLVLVTEHDQSKGRKGTAALWSWTGSGWALEHEGLFPRTETFVGPPCAFYDYAAEDLVVARMGLGQLHWVCRADPTQIKVAPAKAMKAKELTSLVAVSHPKLQRPLLVASSESWAAVFQIGPKSVTRLAAGKNLVAAVFDPKRGLVGCDPGGRLWVLKEKEWKEAKTSDGGLLGLAQDRRSGRLLTFGLEEKKQRVELRFLQRNKLVVSPPARWFVPTCEEITFAIGGAGQVVVCEQEQTLYSKGAKGGNLKTDRPATTPLCGRRNTLQTTADGLWLIDQSRLLVWRTKNKKWAQVAAIKAPEARQCIHVSAWSKTLWMVDQDFGLWSAEGHRPWRSVSVEGDVPASAPREAGFLAFDPLHDRVVAFGLTQPGQTWTFAAGRWSCQPKQKVGPGRGAASAVSTKGGVYLLQKGVLWLLRSEGWVRAGEVPARKAWRLVYDPTRSVLLAAGTELFVFDAKGQPKALGPIPKSARPTPDAEIAVDPEGDQLVVVLAPGEISSADLSVLMIKKGALPAPPKESPEKKTPLPKDKQTKPKKAGSKENKLVTQILGKLAQLSLYADAPDLTCAHWPHLQAPKDPEAKEDDEPKVVEKGFPVQTLEATAANRHQNIRTFAEKSRITIPQSFVDFVNRYGYPEIKGSPHQKDLWFYLNLDLSAYYLATGQVDELVGAEPSGGLKHKGQPARGLFLLSQGPDHMWGALADFPTGKKESLWILIGNDATQPDGAHLAPIAGRFDQLVVLAALGVADILLGPANKRSEALRLFRRLDAPFKAAAFACLDELEKLIMRLSLQSCEHLFHEEFAVPQEKATTKTQSRNTVFLLTPREISSGELLCRKAGKPEWADMPFVFYSRDPAVDATFDAVPDPFEYTAEVANAGRTIGQELFDYLSDHGGAPSAYRYYPLMTKADLRAIMETHGWLVRQLTFGSTSQSYTLAHGAKAVLERIEGLRKLR